jgi:hypothetical protein
MRAPAAGHEDDFQKHFVSFETPPVLSFRLCYFSTAILENDKKSVLFEQARTVSRRPWRHHD